MDAEERWRPTDQFSRKLLRRLDEQDQLSGAAAALGLGVLIIKRHEKVRNHETILMGNHGVLCRPLLAQTECDLDIQKMYLQNSHSFNTEKTKIIN